MSDCLVGSTQSIDDEARARAPKLIVVDDEPDVGAFICEVAKAAGFCVEATHHSIDFARLYTVDTDVAVLDLLMPGLDGVELIRFLADNNSDTSIVLISGMDKGVLNAAQNLAREQGLHVLGTLAKPFRKKELESVLARYHQTKRKDPSGGKQLPTADELRDAIGAGELSVAYQPKVRIADGELAGVEALARWRRKSKGMVPPSYFVPLAERSGLIQELTDFVMHEALRQSRAWRGAGLPIDLSINMSPLTLTDLDIPEKLERLMWEMELEPRHLVIEVTETALMGDLVRSLDTLTRLRMKGFGLAIDDFGTGYSSMQHLVRAPFSELKIDRAFVSYIDRDDECKAVVNVSIALAHELGMTVVAEGVETERIYDMLRDMRCDEAQGFWLSRPFAGHKAIHWYNGWKEQLNSDSRIHAD